MFSWHYCIFVEIKKKIINYVGGSIDYQSVFFGLFPQANNEPLHGEMSVISFSFLVIQYVLDVTWPTIPAKNVAVTDDCILDDKLQQQPASDKVKNETLSQLELE